VSRALKRRFLQRVVDTSQQIITISEHSKASIMRDLGVPDARIELVRFPFDDAFAERVLTLRKAVARRDIALFVGGFLPHKNLPRLLAAFAATRFCAGGGELVLVAGTPEQARTFADGLDARQRGYVRVRPPCPQADLDELFATSLFLVQPSLEEGFGLPAWEALCCGLPVCVSEGGALPEVTKGYADPFPATSTAAMAAAIDRCAATARGVDAEAASDLSARVRADAPTVRQFGARFAGVVARNVVAQ
jgi:glycosyltransferase involved in cell wall biosynthesis